MSERTRKDRRGGRLGYTLLEVVLSLVLVSLVLLCVTAAVDVQMRVTNTGRHHVEEAQLARTLLHRMADDLRAALPYHAPRQSAMSTTSGSAALSSGESGDSSTSSTADSASTTVASGDTPLVVSSIPGIYGGEDWLQVDICRLLRPRRATPSAIPGDDDPAGVGGGDLKSVAYYLSAVNPATDPTLAPAALPSNASHAGGLVRRELDRVLITWSGGTPSAEQARTAETLLASEVLALQLSYSDGLNWYTSWDTASNGALPQAIEIVLSLQTSQGPRDYRLVVDVPAARSGCLPEAAVMSSGNTASAVSTTFGSSSESSSNTSTGGR